MTCISKLKLTNFRNYSSYKLDELEQGFVVLTGPNGSGKTNILEAVSFLAPGRGLRRAKIDEIRNHAANDSWAVSARVITGQSTHDIGTGSDPQSGQKRLVRIDGQNISAQANLGEYLSIFWLTPQMDSLFLDAASSRRRFLDRMILNFDPAHLGRTKRYEKALSQRSRLLKDGNADHSWLTALEIQMAQTGVALSAMRLDFISRLNKAFGEFDHPHFPDAHIKLSGFIEDELSKRPAVELEERFCHALAHSREADSVTGGAAIGPHRSDFIAIHKDKNLRADQCSTGEQKILLTALVLAHAILVSYERIMPPVLLLDEVTAHLDEARRESLFSVLGKLGGQIWLTGTHRELFGDLKARWVNLG